MTPTLWEKTGHIEHFWVIYTFLFVNALQKIVLNGLAEFFIRGKEDSSKDYPNVLREKLSLDLIELFVKCTVTAKKTVQPVTGTFLEILLFYSTLIIAEGFWTVFFVQVLFFWSEFIPMSGEGIFYQKFDLQSLSVHLG